MKKILYRLLLLFYSKFFSTDNLSNKFPISVKGIILDNDKYLLVKNERSEWDFPGGKLDKGDSVKKTLIREIKEELNLDVLIKKLVYAENHIVNGLPVMIVVFETLITSDEKISLSYEHINYNFYNANEIKGLKLADWVINLLNN